MTARYIEERKRFSKRKGKSAEEQYIDNFQEFAKCIKNIEKNFSSDLFSSTVFIDEVRAMISQFDKEQERLIAEVEKNLQEEIK